MAETYCGKSCAECNQKEALNCPGCKQGPGKELSCECEVAQCCRGKGHEVCDTCEFKGNCGKLQSMDYQLENRKMRFESELHQKEAIAKRAVILGKWLWPLFWIIVPSAIAGIMSNEYTLKVAPGVYEIGLILRSVCCIAYGVILLKLSSEEDRYRTAGICTLISAAVNILVVVATEVSKPNIVYLIITLLMSIVALVGEYNEYIAHSLVLTNVDDELSEKWINLWNRYIGSMVGLFGSLIIMIFVPILGVLGLLGATIVLVVVSIKKLVYLYRTAQIFRNVGNRNL